MGMNRHTGERLEGVAHIRQSVKDILTTPKGTRAGGMVLDAHGRRRHIREYGLEHDQLVDKPINASFRVMVIALVAKAVDDWEPRFNVRGVDITEASPGAVTVGIDGIELIAGKPARLEGIDILGAVA